jgi:hypothetical protein
VIFTVLNLWIFLQVITQYVAFIIIEVIIFGIILYFCLPLADTSFVSARRKWSFGWHVQKANDSKAAPNCQRSVEAVSGHEAPKTSNCRPSVEALNVSGKDRYALNLWYWISSSCL